MDIAKRLKQHYGTKSFELSFTGVERQKMNILQFKSWPEHEESRFIGEEVLYFRQESEAEAPDAVGYFVLDACLDVQGKTNPDVFYLPQEMQGQKILVIVYVDPCNAIRKRVIGGCSRLNF